MVGVVPAGGGLLWSRGGSLRVSGPSLTCVWALRMAQIHGAAAVDGRRQLIHWDRQSMPSPRW